MGSPCSIVRFLCRALYIVFVSFSFGSLHCLSFFELRLLTTPVVFSNLSYISSTQQRNILIVIDKQLLNVNTKDECLIYVNDQSNYEIIRFVVVVVRNLKFLAHILFYIILYV